MEAIGMYGYHLSHDAIGAELDTAWQLAPNSVQSSFSRTVRLH